MLGQASGGAATGPRRWMQRWWGEASIDSRQKWDVVWPRLRALPRTLRLLDAGCGAGTWALELAARRPGWRVVGVDLDRAAIAEAERVRQRLGMPNASFACADFLEYRPEEPFDVVLSISSAHYAAESGEGPALFARLASWLRPGGLLVLFAPRRGADVPLVRGLPAPYVLRDLFTPAALGELCRGAGLAVVTLDPVIGSWGTLAKQVRRAADGSRALAAATYPVQITLATLDRLRPTLTGHAPSASLLLVARREPDRAMEAP